MGCVSVCNPNNPEQNVNLSQDPNPENPDTNIGGTPIIVILNTKYNNMYINTIELIDNSTITHITYI